MEIKPPENEFLLGMEVYKSGAAGVGGRLKQLPEDFVVEEILLDGRVLEVGKNLWDEAGSRTPFLHLTLEKYNWDTLRAVKELARSLRISEKRIGFAGTKDKRALTTQRISVYGKTVEDFSGVSIKDIVLRDFSYEEDSIGLGSLSGNRFTVTIRGIEGGEGEVRDRVSLILSELRNQVPAFYGIQRFGDVRPITHLVGREILRGDFRAAVMVYLGKDFPGEEAAAAEARRRFMETGDVREALRNFPSHLGYEHAMLNYLVNNPEDYLGALRVLPKTLRLMFVHAHQSYVFNKALSEYIRRGIPVEKLPLPGYKTKVDEVTADILSEEGVECEDYKIRGAFDFSSKGGYRNCFTPVEGVEVLEVAGDELNSGRRKLRLRFSLDKGSYATVFLREIMKS